MSNNSHFWSEIDYFEKDEFACKCGCGFNNINHHLVAKLDKARELSGVPFKLDCGCRCKEHNLSVGGSPTSSHQLGYAVDIEVDNSSDRYKILSSLMSVGFTRLGVYRNFIHCDNDDDKVQNVIWYK